MALTPEEIDALPDYTDAQLLKLYRSALADLGSDGKAIGHDGRQLTRADEKFVWSMIEKLEERVAADDAADSTDVQGVLGIALTRFGNAR